LTAVDAIGKDAASTVSNLQEQPMSEMLDPITRHQIEHAPEELHEEFAARMKVAWIRSPVVRAEAVPFLAQLRPANVAE
jgi:hypothetical protein